MTVRIHCLHNVLQHEPAETTVALWSEGLTPREIVETHRLDSWVEGDDITVSVRGRILEQSEWDEPVRDGDDVVLCPKPHGFFTLLIVSAIIAFAASWAYQKLVGVPTLGSQDRGDEESPTYSFDRIHTEFRAGFPVPLLYGEHDHGGQVIFTNVSVRNNQELLRVIMVLSAGRCESIGGQTGGLSGEFNQHGSYNGSQPSLGTFPTGVRVSGNLIDPAGSPYTGAQAWGRLGEDAQSPLPVAPFGPWAGVSATLQVNGELEEQGQEVIHTITATTLISRVEVLISFPGGLFKAGSSGGFETAQVSFVLSWRIPGQGWRANSQFTVQETRSSSFTHVAGTSTLTAGGEPVTGPIEVRVRRTSTAGGTEFSTFAVWRSLNYKYSAFERDFSYPGSCLLALEVPATEQTTGGRTEFVARVRGRKVRVWDATVGGGQPSTERYWDQGSMGSYTGIWSYNPGQNPAWVLADFLTSRDGLGHQLTDDQVDWPAFRNWADFCDQDASVGGSNEAYMRFDGVFDRPGSAWDHVLSIAQAGRAVPYIRNNKVSVKYNYSAAHGRGLNAVPAKTVKQLVSTTNVANFQVTYLNTRRRPAVIDVQFLNEAKDFAQDTRPVEDPNGGFNRPATLAPLDFTKDTVSMFGVTRESQVIREALFAHAVNRTVRSEIVFEIGPEALACEIGDLLAVQHDSFRPFDTEAYSYRIGENSIGSSVKLDREIVLAAATSYEFVLREDDGTISTVGVTQAAGTYPAGTAISIDTSAHVVRGAPVIWGESSAVQKTYEIIEIALEQDLTRKVRAVDWVPANHAIASLASLDIDNEYYASEDQLLVDDNSAAVAENVSVTRMPATGEYRIGWEQPTPYASRMARVYLRRGSQQVIVAEEGDLVSETVEEPFTPYVAIADAKSSETLTHFLTPGETYTVAIAIADSNGHFQALDAAAKFTFVADEFPPISAVNVPTCHVTTEDESLLLQWTPLGGSELDYYEVRRGPTGWAGAVVLARTRDPWVRLHLPAVNTSDLPGTFLVAARSRSGLYSREPLVVTPGSTALPYVQRTFMIDEDPDPGSSGTHTGTVYGSGELTLADGAAEGSWESAEFTIDANQRLGLAIYAEAWMQDDAFTVGDATFTVGSGEARWRCLGGRDASVAAPGLHPDETVGDMTMLVGDLTDDRRVGTYRGDPGYSSLLRIWFRTCLATETLSTKSYELYGHGVRRMFAKVQFKVQLFRSSLDHNTHCKDITLRGIA